MVQAFRHDVMTGQVLIRYSFPVALSQTLVLSYTSVVPAGVATSVMTSQSMVLSGGGASVSVMTPRMLERLFFTFSVVSDEPSTCGRMTTESSQRNDARMPFPYAFYKKVRERDKKAYGQLALDGVGRGDDGAGGVMLHHVGEFR